MLNMNAFANEENFYSDSFWLELSCSYGIRIGQGGNHANYSTSIISVDYSVSYFHVCDPAPSGINAKGSVKLTEICIRCIGH
jgi:hypothetical protein